MPSYVITGANRGIGLEFVRQLSATPDNTVFALVRNIAKSTELVAMKESRKNLHIVYGDLSKAGTFKVAAAEVAKVTGGTLDFLINNASWVPGIGRAFDGFESEADLEAEFIEAFRVNVVGTIHATNAFFPLIRAASAQTDFTPKVITLGSGVAALDFITSSGLDLHASYTIFKAAVAAVVAKYAATYYKENIIFFTICPGAVDTNTLPPTPEQMANLVKVVESFKRAAPGWNGKPFSPEESVNAMFSVIDKLTKNDNGAFLSHKGNHEWL